jgi:hypothetical protein
VFLPDLDAAIDQVVREHPDYFNLDEQQGPGGYRLLKRDAYVAAVVAAAGKRASSGILLEGSCRGARPIPAGRAGALVSVPSAPAFWKASHLPRETA